MELSSNKAYLYRRIVQAKLFIETHFCHGIDLDNIADEAHFSKFHFIRLFKTIYGKTPHQYLISVRIEKAQLLLRNGHSVSEVCFEVGFDSPTSFTGLFKRIAGTTPSAYQRQQARRTADIDRRPLWYIPNCFADKIAGPKNSNFQEV
jgi:AraC-like DNA-binding protein